MPMRWLLALLIFATDAPASAAPANTLRDMFAELGQCLSPLNMPEGADVTLRFSLNRRGELIGKPVVTYAKFPDDPNARAETAKSIAKAFGDCLPLSITDALGGAIAGRPIAYRMTGAPKGKGI